MDPGLVLAATYAVLLAVNSLTVAIANALFPANVVLGTNSISWAMSLAHSMTYLTVLGTFAIPLVRQYERSRGGRMFTPPEWMALYFVLNFAGIWLVSRFADQIGLGVSSWFVVLVLAAVLDALQGMAMMQLEKFTHRV